MLGLNKEVKKMINYKVVTYKLDDDVEVIIICNEDQIHLVSELIKDNNIQTEEDLETALIEEEIDAQITEIIYLDLTN